MARVSSITSLLLFLSIGPPPSNALVDDPAAGVCQLGIASADLDINNVRARLYNTGGLFYGGSGAVYTVPKEGSVDAVFAAGIWIGGVVNGELRMVAADYSDWELWPGPLDDAGNPPSDCTQFDHLYKVSRQDVIDFEDTGVAARDLADWPAHLGAPVVDGDGNPDNYDLDGGDRPRIFGDQTIWWVMNDKANAHRTTQTEPLGVEVQVTAFAFKRSDALNNTTFYEYKVINKGGHRIEDTYLSIWVDPDLGGCCDDYVGSDTTLSLGFVYNGREKDPFYGSPPPAVGFDFFEGPVVDNDGLDNNHDGEIDEAGESIGMTSFVYYNNDRTATGNPEFGNPIHYYNYQRGIWKDGERITFGGNGRGFSQDPAPFMYPGDPTTGQYWSEENVDGNGKPNPVSDRRFLMTTGPFTFAQGDTQTVTIGVVWARGSDRLDSVRQMKEADKLAQAAFDVAFDFPSPPDAPRVAITELDETIVLKWSYQPSDNNYFDLYEAENTFLADRDVDDKTYNFEGYIVTQYASEADQVGQVIATFDVPNNVTRVFDIVTVDPVTGTEVEAMSADGTDSGVQHYLIIDGLTNYTDYYYGVQAYAYNVNSNPKVFKSPVSRMRVRPSSPLARDGGTRIHEDALGTSFSVQSGRVTMAGQSNGVVKARVVDPTLLTGDTYTVKSYSINLSDDSEHSDLVTSYDILNSGGAKVFDGSAPARSLDQGPPQGADVFIFDGLSWSITGLDPGALDLDPDGALGVGPGAYAFTQVQGAVPGDACDPGAFSSFGCPQVGGNWVYGSFNGTGEWLMFRLGAGPEASIGAFAPNDFEIRVTDTGSYGYHLFPGDAGMGSAHWVPFEIWDIGATGRLATNDPSDDVQMIPIIFSDSLGSCEFTLDEIAMDPFGIGWPVSDRIYGYYAVDNDYQAWATAIAPIVDAHPDGCPRSPETDEAAALIDEARGRPLQRLIFLMNPASPNYRREMIPVGNVIRFLTTKPDPVFTVNTAGFAVKRHEATAAKEALDAMAIVPNPYKGASDYEITNLVDVVRFTNMPREATVRIFTLAGTLIKTIVKSSPSTSIEWDLRTDEDLPIGSGMYLVHVEVPGVGEKVIKFGAVRKRAQLQFY